MGQYYFTPGTVDLFSKKQKFTMDSSMKSRLRNFRSCIAQKKGKPFYSLKDPDFAEKNLKMLVEKYSYYFDVWWQDKLRPLLKQVSGVSYDCLYGYAAKFKSYWYNEDDFNWVDEADEFICHEQMIDVLKVWDKIDWQRNSIYLTRTHEKHFQIWWKKLNDQERMGIYERPTDLIDRCAPYFDEWFDLNKMQPWDYSSYFAVYCTEHFDKWFVPEKRAEYMAYDSRYYPQYLTDKFDTWFTKETYNYKNLSYLIQYNPEKFDVWWDKEKVSNVLSERIGHTTKRTEGEFSQIEVYRWYCQTKHLLSIYCADKFEIWYSRKHFPMTDVLVKFLEGKCEKHKHLWQQDYIIYKLKK
jgi:hypothetical protein